ncbi:hypothetical protein ABID39_000540 [Bartonella japonica]|uniref:Uncharacterized protein n=1 Tax=Bartonella japonica TaxID=357761 RepID=A0ABV2FMR5_9HYPH
MLFSHLPCRKEDFLSFTTWILLSGFGMLLANNPEMRAYWLKQLQTNHFIKMNTLDPESKCDHFNAVTIENKRIVFYIDPILPIDIFQNLVALNLFLIRNIVFYIRLEDLQTHYFLNQRAPPLV